MLKHYFKTAFRSLLRKKLYTSINILGLAVGLAVCLAVLGNISYEFSFEDFHDNKHRIFRVECDYSYQDEQWRSASVMAPLGEAIANEIPEVEKAAVFRTWPLKSLKIDNKRSVIVDDEEGSMVIHHPKLVFADPTYLEVFTFPMVEGNPQAALTEPFSALITEEAANRYFSDRNPIGRTIEINDRLECHITGVLKNIPQNTQLYCEFVVSYATLDRIGDDTRSWNQINGDYAYLLLARQAPASDVVAKVPDIVSKYLDLQDVGKWHFRIKPLDDIYFSALGPGSNRWELNPVGEPGLLFGFAAVAFFVLLIAIANFINLSTAKSGERTKEIGVRRTLGAFRKHLVYQFLGESVIMAIVAMLISVAIYQPFKLWVEDYLPREMVVDFYDDPVMLISAVLLILLVGVVAGLYPSLYLSRLSTIAVLQGKAGTRSPKSFLRRALVVFQFGVAAVFIFVTQVLVRQIDHVTSLDLGFDTENMLVLNFESPQAASDCQLMKNEILAQTDGVTVTATDCPPGTNSYGYQIFFTDEARDDSSLLYTPTFSVDADFISMFGLQILEGGAFTDEMAPNADNVVIITESLVRRMGWQRAVGSKFYRKPDGFCEVVGVVKDFHGTPLDFSHRSDLVLTFSPENRTSLIVKLPEDNVSASISAIRNLWQSTVPEYDFRYNFLDETIDRNYDDLRGGTWMFFAVAFFAVGIACLGIFGLVSYTAEQRTKEIGIRKVLGASVSNVVRLLSGEFALLVLIANVIGLPIGYLLAIDFLSYEPYPISIGPFSFIVVCLAAVVFALATAGIQSVKAGLANPVDALRSE